METIEYYGEKREFLLNYLIIEKKIERFLKDKKEVFVNDLGVSEKYSYEYLKLYHRNHFEEFTFEETPFSLRRIS
jgi:hypothetical protein